MVDVIAVVAFVAFMGFVVYCVAMFIWPDLKIWMDRGRVDAEDDE